MPLISLIFFLSGLSALVYQLLWMRHLGFIFGNTVYASATVLTAFMGGLAIGSHVFGRIAEKLKNPVRGFAILEFVIAAYAVCLPMLFKLIQHAYTLAYRHVSDDFLFLTALRFVLALAILLIPCICMGGTLPVLIRGLARDDEHFGARMGWLYGVNTMGAVAGVLLSGFYLIPEIGLTNTNLLAAFTDVIAGAGALIVCGRFVIHDPTAGPAEKRFRWRALPVNAKWAIAVATVCGFVSLALEVVWFRALILVFGSTTYSFTVMLAVFLFGIGFGSLLVAPLLDRMKSLVSFLALIVAAIGLYTLWSMYRFDRGPEYLLEYLVAEGFTWKAMNIARLNIALSHLAVPALLFGAAFAAATRIVRHESESSARTVGFVYAMNTLGALVGSFVAGFLMLPLFGMESSLLALAGLLLAFGGVSVILIGTSTPARIVSGAALLATLLHVAIFPPSWSHALLASGAYFGPFNYVRDDRVVLRETIMSDRLLYYEEGLSSTVSVHMSSDEEMVFCVDGKTEADQGTRGMVVQRMIGHLPALFHPAPRKGMNLGLGAGVSFGALGCHPFDHLEVVEIEPVVAKAAEMWGPYNHWIVKHPNAIFTYNDGRNHLFCTTNRYDVITSDPFEPVVAGASHLFTVDHFQNARSKLNPGGIMGQWIPMYEMSPEDYLTIVRSFVHVFPETALFYTGFDTILIGFNGPISIDPEVVRRNFSVPEVKASLADVGFTSPEMLLSMFVADLTQKPEFVGSGPLNTDEKPIIEYSVPRSAIKYTTDENQSALLRVFTPVPESWAEALGEDDFVRVKNEHEAVRLMLEAGVARSIGDTEEAFRLLAKANETAPDNPVVKNELVAMLTVSAGALMLQKQYDAAESQYRLAVNLDPTDFRSLQNLVVLSMRVGRIGDASAVLDHAEKLYPESPLIIALRGKFLFTTGEQKAGIDKILQAAKIQPDSMGIWTDLKNLATLSGNQVLVAYAQQNIERIREYLDG